MKGSYMLPFALNLRMVSLDSRIPYKAISQSNIEGYEIMNEMYESARTHTDYEYKPLHLLERRPNESDEVNAFTLKNYRRITHELFDNWVSKSGRIFNSNSFYITTQSESLSAYLDEVQFDWLEYIRQVAYPQSLINPNQLFFFFPYNSDLPDEAPSESLPQYQRVDLKPTLVSYDNIRHIDDDIVIFESGRYVEIDKKKYSTFFAIDDTNWYELIPYIDSEDKVKLRPEIWYNHNFGFIPMDWLPGRIFFTEKEQRYRKSIIATAFEYLDEFIGLFKDSQAVDLLHAYPHLWIIQVDCNDCDGTGLLLNEKTCQTCKGTGRMIKPNPEQAMSVPVGGNGIDNPTPMPPMGWAYPGVDIMDRMDKKAKETLRSAFLSIGLRPFVDVSESGEAKKYRLEDQQDRLEDCGNGIKVFAESMLMQVEYYIKRGQDSDNIEDVVISKPRGYQALTSEELDHLINTNNRVLREDYFRQIYIDKNGNSDITNKILDSVLIYAPLINKTDNEISQSINLGAYDNNDIVRADYAFKVFEQLSLDTGFMNKTFSELAADADLILNEWGILNTSIT